MSNPEPASAVCVPWEADTFCCQTEWDAVPPELQERSLALAWATLRTLTAGRVGNCPVTMRPCLTPPCNECAGNWLNPRLIDGQWVNVVCGGPRCSCARLCEIVTGGPIALVTEVLLDGQPMDLDSIRVDNGNRIVRQDGGCWPSCQDMGQPLGEANTLGITYVPGVVPDAAGLAAAGTLACEFSKACTGAKCRIPASVTSIARQGVVMTMSEGLFADGLTGIREVDAYILSLNPTKAKRPSYVWSPDVPWAGHRYQTWPSPSLPLP